MKGIIKWAIPIILVIVIGFGIFLNVMSRNSTELELAEVETDYVPNPQFPNSELGLLPHEIDTEKLLKPFQKSPEMVTDVTPEEVDVASAEVKSVTFMTRSWLYRQFIGIADIRSGMIEDVKENKKYQVKEGQTLKDVLIKSLNEEYAVVNYGDENRKLNLIYVDIRNMDMGNPLVPSEERVEQMKAIYDALHRPGFEEAAANYTPIPGERMPPKTPPSPEEVQKNFEKYMETHYKKMMERTLKYTPKPGEVLPKMPETAEDEASAIQAYIERLREQEK